MNVARGWMLAGLLGLSGALAGCNANYAVDVLNGTPQPLFVKIYNKGNTEATLAASERLGPGDRAQVGPVQNAKNLGAYAMFDTLPNPTRPITVDLNPGMNYFEVHQQGTATSGPLVVTPR